MQRIESNIELWQKEWPLEAFLLQKDFIPFDQKILFKGADPLWKDKLHEIQENALFVYGVDPACTKLILDWLSKDQKRFAAILEDDPERLAAYLYTEEATNLLKSPQATLCYVKDKDNLQPLFDLLYWQAPLIPYAALAIPEYETERSETSDLILKGIQFEMITKNALVEEYMQLGVPFFRNFYANLPQIAASHKGTAFFGKFQGMPAIICGAGPSLSKQIPLLKTLSNSALIFAGGSALNALHAQGFLPHFGAGIDPNSPQEDRLKATSGANLPFFFRSRIFCKAMKFVTGPKLYIPGAGGYDVSEWYEEKLGIASDFLDEGHNVVNFCTEIATRMGCSPIIFIGMDLAFTGRKSYAEGVAEAPAHGEPRIFYNDIYGKITETSWKWLAESDWLSNYAKNNSDVNFINATEGGIGFSGIDNIPFEEVVRTTLSEERKFDIQSVLSESRMPENSFQIIEDASQKLLESLQRSQELIRGLIEELEKELSVEHPKERLQTPRGLLLESDLFDEPAYQYLLDIFHHVYTRLLSRESTILKLNKEGKLSEAEINRAMLSLQKRKLLFLQDVAEVNRLLLLNAPALAQQ